MTRNLTCKYLLIPVITTLIFLGCSRDNPETITNPVVVQKIFPIAEYTLDIPEPSGVAYNSRNNSLLVVSDGQPDIYEINFTGITLNTIQATGSDMEGITLSKNCDTIYVVEEKKKLVTSFDLNGNRLTSFSVNVATSDNSALEGITLKKANNEIFVINEKDPRMILGFMNFTEIWRKTIDYVSDISDIYFEESTNCIWLISDESKMIIKLSATGDLLKQWEIPFLKGEGITIVNDKVYVVNDQDGKLYIFQKPI